MMFLIESSKPFASENNVELVWSRVEPSRDNATSCKMFHVKHKRDWVVFSPLTSYRLSKGISNGTR